MADECESASPCFALGCTTTRIRCDHPGPLAAALPTVARERCHHLSQVSGVHSPCVVVSGVVWIWFCGLLCKYGSVVDETSTGLVGWNCLGCSFGRCGEAPFSVACGLMGVLGSTGIWYGVERDWPDRDDGAGIWTAGSKHYQAAGLFGLAVRNRISLMINV